jgi:hypothetical protein
MTSVWHIVLLWTGSIVIKHRIPVGPGLNLTKGAPETREVLAGSSPYPYQRLGSLLNRIRANTSYRAEPPAYIGQCEYSAIRRK